MVAAMMSRTLAQPFTAAKTRPFARNSISRLVVRAQETPAAPKNLLRNINLSSVLKPAAMAVVAGVLIASPALADDMPGKLFDFDLTLPTMVTEFLLLMVFLDKTWFGPVGKLLDDRDKSIREKLAMFRDNSTEVAKLTDEADRIIAEARAEAQQLLMATRDKAKKDGNQKLDALKKQIDSELSVALEALEKEKAKAFSDLDEQVEKLSAEILEKILPEGAVLEYEEA